MLSVVALVAAIVVPTGKYVTATTDRPAAEIVPCMEREFDKLGVSEVTATDYGNRVDFFYSNLGGQVKQPTMTIEIHDGPQRTIVMYGRSTWGKNVGTVWKQSAKKCFPELRAAKVVNGSS
jgi:hypothetical protein